MEHKITVVQTDEFEHGPPKWRGIEPFVMDASDLFNCKYREPKLPVMQWPLGTKRLLFLTEQRHDGTLYFTYSAISALVSTAEEFLEKKGGDFILSHVYVKDIYDHKQFPTSTCEYLSLHAVPVKGIFTFNINDGGLL